MSEPEYEIQDTHVPHEAEVAEAVDAQMRRTSTQAHIADVAVLAATTPAVSTVGGAGGTYAEAEADAAVVAINALIAQAALTEANVISLDAKINLILKVLQDVELVPSS